MPQPRLQERRDRDRDRRAMVAAINAWIDRANVVTTEVPMVNLIADRAVTARLAQDGATQAYLRANWLVLAAAVHYWTERYGSAVVVLGRPGEAPGGAFAVISAEDIPGGRAGSQLRSLLETQREPDSVAGEVVALLSGDPVVLIGAPGPQEAARLIEEVAGVPRPILDAA